MSEIKVWSGQHAFSNAVVFSGQQMFPLSVLEPQASPPALLSWNGKKWTLTDPPQPYRVLGMERGEMKWTKVRLDKDGVDGILSVAHGGTGLRSIPDGLICGNDGVFVTMPAGSEGYVLTSSEGRLKWMPLPITDNSFPVELAPLVVPTSEPESMPTGAIVFGGGVLPPGPEGSVLTIDASGKPVWRDVAVGALSISDSKVISMRIRQLSKDQIEIQDEKGESLRAATPDSVVSVARIRGQLLLTQGGTGADLTPYTLNSVVLIGSGGLKAVPCGSAGQLFYVSSAGVPSWRDAEPEFSAARPLALRNRTLSLDTSVNLTWSGAHSHLSDVAIAAAASLRFVGGSRQVAPVILEASIVPVLPETGSIWFDGLDLYFRTSTASVALSKRPATTRTLTLTLSLGHQASEMSRLICPIPGGELFDGSPASWRLIRLEACATSNTSLMVYANQAPLLIESLVCALNAGTVRFRVGQLDSGTLLTLSAQGDGSVTCYLIMEKIENT